jgi:fumarate reductase flavoprotein subunit
VISETICDVIVVGGGGSGLAAAIEARALGRDVVLLEKNSQLGGSTAWSIGSVTASGTPYQARKGIADTTEDHWRDMAGFNGDLDGRDNPGLRRVLADAMPDTFRWLLKHGVRFFGPMPEPPHTKPRMHNVLPNSRAFIAHLGRAARRTGVAIEYSSRAVALVVEHGRVVGIDCMTPRETRRFRARCGVVLATGDFASDPELKAQYLGAQEAKIDGVNVTATGDGQKLALLLGARIINGDLALGPELRFVPPPRNLLLSLPPWRALANFMAWSLSHMPPTLLRPFVMSNVTTALAPSPDLFAKGAILINKTGRRFTDELERPAFAMPDQLDKAGYVVLDKRTADMFSAWPYFVSTAPGVAYAYIDDYRRNRRDIFTQSPTLEGLAEKLSIPAATLTETARAHNAAARNRPTLGGGPYIALGPVRAVFVHNEGGLAVDNEHRVLGTGDTPIAGLYAAGSTGQGGLLLKGHGHHLAWAFASAVELAVTRRSPAKAPTQRFNLLCVVGDGRRNHEKHQIDESCILNRVINSWRQENIVMLAHNMVPAVDFHAAFAFENVINLFLHLVPVQLHMRHRLIHRDAIVNVLRARGLGHHQWFRQRVAEMIRELPPRHFGDIADEPLACRCHAASPRSHCIALDRRMLLSEYHIIN